MSYLSSGWIFVSTSNLYWKPEQPPPSTDNRRNWWLEAKISLNFFPQFSVTANSASVFVPTLGVALGLLTVDSQRLAVPWMPWNNLQRTTFCQDFKFNNQSKKSTYANGDLALINLRNSSISTFLSLVYHDFLIYFNEMFSCVSWELTCDQCNGHVFFLWWEKWDWRF